MIDNDHGEEDAPDDDHHDNDEKPLRYDVEMP